MQDFAAFVIYSDESIFLYKTDYPPQQLWVNASGIGEVVLEYTSGDEIASRNAGRGDFEIDGEGVVRFDGVGTKACPTLEEGKWSVWFSESEKPALSEGCVSVKLKGYDAPARVACTYSLVDV